MVDILEDIRKSQGIDILNKGEQMEQSNFLQNALKLQLDRIGSRIKGYVTAVEEIMKGRDLSKLDQFEAAKIIGLGTITGKAQQRANALKNMTAAVLKEYISEFMAVVSKISVKETTEFDLAKISNRSLHTLLKDATLGDGLAKLKSPLDFLEIFPLIGLGLGVKRNLGSDEDYLKVEVKTYSTDSIDTSTFDFQTQTLALGDKTYNAVCPLITKHDAYTAPLFNTKLMQYAMSYNVTEQLDKINENCWLSLLGDLLFLALKAEDTATVEKVLDTVDAIKDSDAFVGSLIQAIELQDLSQYSKFPKHSVFILLHYYAIKRVAAEEEKKELMDKVWQNYFQLRSIGGNLSDFLISEKQNDLKKIATSHFTNEFIMTKFYTPKDVVRYCAKELIADLKKWDVAAKL